MNDLQIFEYVDSQKVRTKVIDDQVWFVASDVCKVLGMTNPTESLKALDDDEKGSLRISEGTSLRGGNPNVNVINEAGVYRLIFRSNKPDAKKFQRWLAHDVVPKLLRGISPIPTQFYSPKFIQRFAANQDRVASGYFSVISELGVRLYGKLEIAGYMIAEKDPKGKELRPDISVGKLWAKYLAENYPEDLGRHQDYMHLLPNGMEIPAKMYELALLPKFITFVENVWIKEHAYEYFQARDPKAIEYLVKLIPDIKIPRLAIA